MKEYCVPIIYVGMSNFIVKAKTAEEAERLARQRFADGATPELLGNEYEDIERVGEIEELVPELKKT